MLVQAFLNCSSNAEFEALKAKLPFHDERLLKYPDLLDAMKKAKSRFQPSESRKEVIKEYFGLTIDEYRKIIDKGCARCGSHKDMNLHHKIMKSDGGTNELSNLEPLCFVCHKKEHPWLKKNTRTTRISDWSKKPRGRRKKRLFSKPFGNQLTPLKHYNRRLSPRIRRR